jgi:hypothetical protein
MRWLALMTACTLASAPCPTAHGHPVGERSRSPIVVEVRDDGFDWADAAIGGAAVLGLVLASAGAALVVRPLRTGMHPHPNQKGAAMHQEPGPDNEPDPDRSGSPVPSLQRRRP